MYRVIIELRKETTKNEAYETLAMFSCHPEVETATIEEDFKAKTPKGMVRCCKCVKLRPKEEMVFCGYPAPNHLKYKCKEGC